MKKFSEVVADKQDEDYIEEDDAGVSTTTGDVATTGLENKRKPEVNQPPKPV